MSENKLVDLSQKLLIQVKYNKSISSLLDDLKRVSIVDLKDELHSDDLKKVFWLNIYNAIFQYLRIEISIDKEHIYKEKYLEIAGLYFSLDDIEHGILRKNKSKYSLGYFSKLFQEKTLKQLAVKVLDFRIHFALNCGAKSCPPITIYTLIDLDSQLQNAMSDFINIESDFNKKNNELNVSRLFLWYLADFGGRKGVKNIHSHYIKFDQSKTKLINKPFDWGEKLSNYV